MNTTYARPRNPATTFDASREADAQLRLTARYQPRQAGTGYGRSSGYASPRQYAQASAQPLLRCG